MATGKYPALTKVVTGDFNVMGDVIDIKSGRTKVDTFSAIQTIKYALHSRNCTAIEYCKREDVKYSPVDKGKDVRGAAKRGKRALIKAKRQSVYGSSADVSAAQAKKTKEEAAKQARIAHAAKERNKTRKRALEILAKKTAE